jgi:chaperonin GroES
MGYVMKPLGNRVVLRPLEKEQTSTGIFLPTGMDSVIKGSVVAVGKGAATMSGDLIPMEVEVGDLVIFPKNRGVEVEFENDTLILIHETDIYCIL